MYVYKKYSELKYQINIRIQLCTTTFHSKSTFLTVHFLIQVDFLIQNQIEAFRVSISPALSNTKLRHSKTLFFWCTQDCQSNIQQSKKLLSAFFAALFTICYGIQSWAWYAFTMCPKFYIPLKNLCRVLQMIDLYSTLSKYVPVIIFSTLNHSQWLQQHDNFVILCILPHKYEYSYPSLQKILFMVCSNLCKNIE